MSQRSRLPSVPVAVALVLPLAACESPGDSISPELGDLPVTEAVVSVPFKLDGFTERRGLTEDPSCDESRLLNTQTGEGQATHLGRYHMTISFCVDLTALADGVLGPGESLPYLIQDGTVVAANGDVLRVGGSGEVVPTTDPAFVFMFQDELQFVGGPGRFAGASGEFTTHDWDGTLVLPRGKK